MSDGASQNGSRNIPWLKNARLWMITDGAAARGRDIRALVRDGIAGGVDVVVVRHNELSSAELSPLALGIAAVCRDFDIPWVLAHNTELVRELAPDGVHLGAADPPVSDVCADLAGLSGALGHSIAVGYSAHSLADIAMAASNGADYVWYAPVFATRKDRKVVTGMGLDAAALALRAANGLAPSSRRFPVVFLGGINAGNVRELVARDMRRIAAIGGIIGADDVREAAQALKAALTG